MQRQFLYLRLALIVSMLAAFIALKAMTVHAAPKTDAIVQPPCNESDFDAALNTVQSSGGGTVTFNCGVKTITLGFVKSINSNVVINGGTLDTITLSGGNASGLFQINGGKQLSLLNITLANAKSFSAAIENFGGLLLNSCVFTNNHNIGGSTSTGGAIYNSGMMTVTNCTLTNNTAGNGGAIYVEGGGAASMSSTTVMSNSAQIFGGGIFNGGTITLTNSTVSSNVLTDTVATTRGGGAFNAGQFIMNGGSIVSNRNVSNTIFSFTGGGLHNGNGTFPATMNLTGVTLQGNNASTGGAIYNWESTLVMRQTIVEGNSALVTAGGLNNSGNTAILNIYNSQILSNSSGVGGGIYNSSSTSGATVFISQTRISGNMAGFAGGIRNFTGSFFSIYQSLVDNNKAIITGTSAKGGGAANRGLFYAENTTFSGNIADDNLGTAQGGGIVSEQNSQVTLVNVTLSANKANIGGALCTIGSSGTSCSTGGGDAASDLKNTILNDSHDSDTNALIDNCAIVAMLDNFGNIDSRNSCLFASSLTGTNPQLGSLTNNGGPTFSHMPQSGSLAINGGTNTGCPAVDQRGGARPRTVGNPCDSGSIEVGASVPMLYLPLIIK